MTYKLIPCLVTMAAMVLLSTCLRRAAAPQGEAPPTINVARVTVDSVTLRRDFPGYLTADDEVALVARVSGYLTSKPHRAGDFVRQGAVLFTIESGRYADAVKQAQAQLADAVATHAYAEENYRAMTQALQSDAVSQMEVLQAKSDVATAEAAIRNAEAALRTAQTNLDYCTVRAPFDGHVSASAYSVGAYLAGSVSPVTLATIYMDSLMTAHFAIDAATPILTVDVDSIPITFADADLTRAYTARLSYVAPALDRSTGTMQLQAKVRNPLNELHSGMYCVAALPCAVIPRAMLVRDASIGSDQLGRYLFTVSDSNTVVYTPIEVGQLVADTLRVVTRGLAPTDRYVTDALLKVRHGMKITPKLTE